MHLVNIRNLYDIDIVKYATHRRTYSFIDIKALRMVHKHMKEQGKKRCKDNGETNTPNVLFE